MVQISEYTALGFSGMRRTFLPKTEDTGFVIDDVLTIIITPVDDFDVRYEIDDVLTFVIDAPETGVFEFIGNFPYSVAAIVVIAGVDYSYKLEDSINVVLEDNTAATFQIVLTDNTVKPSEAVGQNITIAFKAANASAIDVDFSTVFNGEISDVAFNDLTRQLVLRGYDYTAVHRTDGHRISENITPVNEGSIYIDATGTFPTGFAPIWGVVYTGEEDNIIDGVDWFVDTKNGDIIVPLGSNFILTPGTLTFNYATYFTSHTAMMQEIIAKKGWVGELDGVTLANFSSTDKQPVLTMDSESVIDEIGKHLEISGAKFEGTLFPVMRVYSETDNLNGDDNHILDESDFVFDTLKFKISKARLLTEQTVTTVARAFAEIIISDPEVEVDETGSVAIREIVIMYGPWFFGSPITISTAMTEALATTPDLDIVTITISKTNINSVSIVAGGDFRHRDFTTTAIVEGDWTITTDSQNIIIKLTVSPAVQEVGFTQEVLFYAGADWTLQVSIQKINYEDGDTEESISATVTREVAGIPDVLAGDIYEQPIAETEAHCGNVATAILTERGNIYTATGTLPLFKAAALKLGDKVNIEKSSSTIFKGLIKKLDYNIDLNTANAPVHIEARGVGFGI